MRIEWLGHPAFKITSNKGTVIYLDPFITGNPVCPITVDEIVGADIIGVTHGHRDHLGDALKIIKNTGAHLISSPEICFYADIHGVPNNRGSSPINIGGCITHKNITFHATHAVHVSALYGEEWFQNKQMIPNGAGMGFVLEMEDGMTIYYAGDTGLFGDMKLIGELYKPDIAMLPIGGRYTMTPKLAARAAAMIGAKLVIPMHYNTFPFNQQDPTDYQKLINNLTRGIKVAIIKPGEYIEV